MASFSRNALLGLVSILAVFLAACGGGGSNPGGGGKNPTTPTVTVTPGKLTISTSESLTVTVAVSGTSGTPTGTVKVSGGGYTSSSTALTAGSANITIPANSLAAGTVTLTGSYTPDSGSSSTYNSASNTATVTVTGIVSPTVTVTPSANSISVAQALTVTVAVAGGSGSATPTGTVTLSNGGNYTSLATALSSGSATINVAAASLPSGQNTLTATYAPDAGSSNTYKQSTGTALVSVTVATPTVTVTPASQSIGTGQALSVAVAVAGFPAGAVPTGTVTLSATGGWSSGATTLASGSATISIPAGSMAAGSATLTASYSPDTASAAIYGSASKQANITVTAQNTPTVTVSPASQSLATSQSLSVSVKVKDPNNAGTPTGAVVLTSGSYNSSSTTLSGGNATVNIPAWSLTYGSDLLSVAYTPDTASTGVYTSSTGTATVSLARSAPTITVTPAALNISPLDTLKVTVAVGGTGGAPLGTGTFTLSGGGYNSAAVTLSGASTDVTIPAGSLTSGSVTLAATYTPDTPAGSWYKSASGTSAAVMVSSLVTVNQSTTLAPVTDQLLGMNLATWYDVVTNADAINTNFGLAGIKAIRWPGGSWSDNYHWGMNNTAPSQCPNSDNKFSTWGGWQTFPQFMTAITKAGQYDLALSANYGSNASCNGGGDPAEAAAWAKEAADEGYPASHITVGNENYGTWEVDLHPAGQRWDPTTYANSVIGANGYYTLIKNASPTTRVGVVVDAGSIQPGVWDSTVLSKAKNSYDFVEYHIYPKNPGQEDDTYLVHNAAQDLKAALDKIKQELIAAGVPVTNGVPDIPIYVGEMGSVSSNPGKQSWSITQGLYAGQTLGEMMNAGVVRATWWIGFGNCNGAAGSMSSSLYGWQDFGAYNVFADGSGDTGPDGKPCNYGAPIGTMNPTARAFQLFSNLAVNGESALKTIPFTGNSTDIKAYAATHSGGTALFLFNLNQSQSLPVTITLSKTPNGNSSGVTVITYDKTIYDKSNPANVGGAVWADPTTTDMGAQNLPLTLTLTPWSMNVVIIK